MASTVALWIFINSENSELTFPPVVMRYIVFPPANIISPVMLSTATSCTLTPPERENIPHNN